MLPIKSWRIYYPDGSTFSSEDGTWADAPPFGVQCVVYYHESPYKTVDGGVSDGDVYYYQGDGYPDDVKLGVWMDAEGLYRIMDYAARSVSP